MAFYRVSLFLLLFSVVANAFTTTDPRAAALALHGEALEQFARTNTTQTTTTTTTDQIARALAHEGASHDSGSNGSYTGSWIDDLIKDEINKQIQLAAPAGTRMPLNIPFGPFDGTTDQECFKVLFVRHCFSLDFTVIGHLNSADLHGVPVKITDLTRQNKIFDSYDLYDVSFLLRWAHMNGDGELKIRGGQLDGKSVTASYVGISVGASLTTTLKMTRTKCKTEDGKSGKFVTVVDVINPTASVWFDEDLVVNADVTVNIGPVSKTWTPDVGRILQGTFVDQQTARINAVVVEKLIEAKGKESPCIAGI